jgi:hypothetical protein
MAVGQKHNCDLATMTDFFRVQKLILPQGNILPAFETAANWMLDLLGIKPQTFHKCKNECIIFRDSPVNKYAGLTSCPICKTKRLDEFNKPFRELSWISLIDQLRARHQWPSWTKMTAKVEDRQRSKNWHSIHDSPAWHKFLDENPDFEASTYHLLSLMTDGITPWGTYSMWPFWVKDLMLQPENVAKDELMMLVGIEHGPKAPKDMNPILELIIEDLIKLWTGVMRPNPAAADPSLMKAALFMVQADYPGFSKLLKLQDAGSILACMSCWLRGTSVNSVNRVAYPFATRLLPLDDARRGLETRPPPEEKTTEEYRAIVKSFVAAKKKKEKKDIQKLSGVRGMSEVANFPFGRSSSSTASHRAHFPVIEHSPFDLSHITADVFGHYMHTLRGDCSPTLPKHQTAENLAVHEKIVSQHRLLKLTKANQDIADQRYCSIKGPEGFIRPNVTPFRTQGFFTIHNKENYCYNGLGLFTLRGLTPAPVQSMFQNLCEATSYLVSVPIAEGDLPFIEKSCIDAIVEYEAVMPVTEHAIVVHLYHEVQKTVRRFGPTTYTDGLILERSMSRLTRKMHTRFRPEVSLIKQHCLSAAVQNVGHRFDHELKKSFNTFCTSVHTHTYTKHQHTHTGKRVVRSSMK